MLRALLAFAAFAAVVTITPGLDTMLVVRTAALSGRRAAFASAGGIMLGCLAWAVASALGITALLAASRVGYEVLRWAGVAYLCYLGVRTLWRHRRPATEEAAQPRPERSAGRAFRVGLTTNLLNPKVGVFYLSVLPQFLPHGVSPLLASTAMALVHNLEGLIWFTALVFLVGRAARVLSRPPVRRRLDQLTGVVFLAFGLRLAIESHRTAA
jgi:threonine/homoserine/homoserine lactone efflux protein